MTTQAQGTGCLPGLALGGAMGAPNLPREHLQRLEHLEKNSIIPFRQDPG